MKQIFLDIPYDPTEKGNLAKNYLISLPKTEELKTTLRNIFTQLDLFNIVKKNGIEEIDALYWDSKERTLVYKIYQRDLLSGANKEQIIVKKLRRFHHTYELRINSEFHYYRILFQFNNLDRRKDPFIILSYGFTKIEGDLDLTDSLASSNDKIKIDTITNMKSRKAFKKWIFPDTLDKL